MKNFKNIDHIGYAVRDIETTAKPYVDAGWILSEIFDEKVQNTKIAFLTKPSFITIELVAPRELQSPIDNVIKNNGVAPYHICYVVDDIMQSVEDLFEEGFKPLFLPVESVAMDNRHICYLYHMDIGAVEIVEEKKRSSI